MESVPDLTSAQDGGLAFWRARSGASLLDNSVQADCHEQVFIPKPKRFCIKRFICRHVCYEKKKSSRVRGKFKTKVKFNTREVRENPSQTRWRWNLKNKFQNSRKITCRSWTRWSKESETAHCKTCVKLCVIQTKMHWFLNCKAHVRKRRPAKNQNDLFTIMEL